MNLPIPFWLIPKLSKKRDRWCAEYGDGITNLHGYGPTPREAYEAMVRLYYGHEDKKPEPSAPVPERWAISIDGETFHTAEGATTYTAALASALADYPGAESFFVGKEEPPTPPEEFFDCTDWLENVSCSDEYSGDYAEGWDMSSKEQQDELNAEVREVMAKWLSRHHLYPTFFTVPNPIEYKRLEAIETEA